MPALARDVEFSCGRGRFVSVVRAVCHTQLGNQLSAYAALLYFTARHGYHAVLDPFQLKIIGAVFRRVETRAVTLTLLELETKVHTKVRNHREGPYTWRFQPGEGPSRGLLRDYEPSYETF